MAYRIKKSLQQYSLVDLLDIMGIEKHPENLDAKNEFHKRNPSEKEIEIAKKGLKIRIESRNKPLPVFDKIYCFFVPFTSQRDPFLNNATEIKEEFEKHQDEYEFYCETKRVEELKKWQGYARITHVIIISILILTAIISLIFSILKQID